MTNLQDVSGFFEDHSDGRRSSSEEIWNDQCKMEIWLEELFCAILLFDWRASSTKLDVPPYRFPYDPKHLLSIDLFSPASHRSPNAKVTVQDFERALLDAFLNVAFGKEDTSDQKSVHNDSQGKQAKEVPSKFLFWMARAMYRCAEGEDGKFLHYVTPGTLSQFIAAEAKNDRVIRKERLLEWVEIVPLIVSVLFAIHRNALWAQLRDVLDERDLRDLEFPFRLMEIFLNRWADEDLRFLTITVSSRMIT